MKLNEEDYFEGVLEKDDETFEAYMINLSYKEEEEEEE